MKNFSPKLLAALAKDTAVLALHARITCRDGYVLKLVNLDSPSIINGEVYLPNGAPESTAIRTTGGLSSDNLDLQGFLDSSAITISDLQAGKYDFADVLLFLAFINRPDLEQIFLVRGTFGEMQYTNKTYAIELNGLTHALLRNIGYKTTPTCVYTLGDARCKFPIMQHAYFTHLVAVHSARSFTMSMEHSPLYRGGCFLVINGPAHGLSSEIYEASGTSLTLYTPLARMPTVGTLVYALPGCDRTRASCRNTYNNLINFGGHPDIPGQDEMLAPTITRGT